MQKLKHFLASLFPRRFSLLIKYGYHQLHRLFHGKKLLETDYPVEKRCKKNCHTFFGYYDISPFNTKSDEIIYIQVPKELKTAKLILSSLDNKTEQVITTSSAWNWQQGCRLRWMPNNSREIVFNDFSNNQYVARIVNVDTKEEKRIDGALYDISANGKFGLSLDFERLQNKRPGYGYQCRFYSEGERDLSKEGIDLIDIENNTKKRIITYSDISRAIGSDNCDFRNNYINHISFSPTGNKFLFFWLTVQKNIHLASLVVYDMISSEFTILETQKRVSHYVWEDEDHIICTAYNIDQSCYYYRYSLPTKSRTLLTDVLNEDGHPSIINGRRILTDTYPNLKGFQKLIIYDTIKNEKIILLKVYSDCRVEGERRTDLHPRLNAKKSIVCFDSNQNKYRSLNFLILNEEK